MHVFVTFASRHGSTRAIAETVAAELETVGHTTTFIEVSKVTGLDRFDAVVIGSGIYVNRWLEPAREFITTWQEALSRVPLWMFSSGPVGDQVNTDPPEIAGLTYSLNLRDHTVFGGSLDVAKLGTGERLITKVVRAPQGDFRDWDAIRAWARRIGQELDAMSMPVPTAPALA